MKLSFCCTQRLTSCTPSVLRVLIRRQDRSLNVVPRLPAPGSGAQAKGNSRVSYVSYVSEKMRRQVGTVWRKVAAKRVFPSLKPDTWKCVLVWKSGLCDQIEDDESILGLTST